MTLSWKEDNYNGITIISRVNRGPLVKRLCYWEVNPVNKKRSSLFHPYSLCLPGENRGALKSMFCSRAAYYLCNYCRRTLNFLPLFQNIKIFKDKYCANCNLTVNVLNSAKSHLKNKFMKNVHKSLMKAICQQFHTSFAHNLWTKGFSLPFSHVNFRS